MSKIDDLIKFSQENNMELRVHLNPQNEVYESICEYFSGLDIEQEVIADCLKANTVFKILLYPNKSDAKHYWAYADNIEDCANEILKIAKEN